jgi:predicted Zn-dependent protease
VARKTVPPEVRHMAGETEEAYERLRQSLELDDRNWIAHMNHSHWLINEERIAEASRAAERTLRLAPFSRAAVATMATVLALNGNAGRSAELIQQLGSPETFAVPGALTVYYLLLQNFEKANVWAEKGDRATRCRDPIRFAIEHQSWVTIQRVLAQAGEVDQFTRDGLTIGLEPSFKYSFGTKPLRRFVSSWSASAEVTQ